MAYKNDTNGDPTTCWKNQPQQPAIADPDSGDGYSTIFHTNNNDTAPCSYNDYSVDADSGYGSSAAKFETNAYDGNPENNCGFDGGGETYCAAATGNCNPYLNNVPNEDVAAADNPIAEEESQVVPISLDHLSRDELCRMIYRLDYERNALIYQLKALRNQLDDCNKERKKLPQNSYDPTVRGQWQLQQHQLQEQHLGHGVQQSTLIEPAPPTPLEIARVKKRLGEKLTAAIKSAIHGGRKVPKSTITETELSPSLILAIMQAHDGKKISETKRLIKWNFADDGDIADVLCSERLVHPVRHDGTGRIIPTGSSTRNAYNWARFVGMEAKYDKREATLTVVARTTDAGSGRPENVPERAEYSRRGRGGLPGGWAEGVLLR